MESEPTTEAAKLARADGPAGVEVPAAVRAGPWRVRVRAGHRFTRTHGPYALRFNEGEAETSDPAAAEHSAGCGYEVTDLASGEVRNPLPAR